METIDNQNSEAEHKTTALNIIYEYRNKYKKMYKRKLIENIKLISENESYISKDNLLKYINDFEIENNEDEEFIFNYTNKYNLSTPIELLKVPEKIYIHHFLFNKEKEVKQLNVNTLNFEEIGFLFKLCSKISFKSNFLSDDFYKINNTYNKIKDLKKSSKAEKFEVSLLQDNLYSKKKIAISLMNITENKNNKFLTKLESLDILCKKKIRGYYSGYYLNPQWIYTNNRNEDLKNENVTNKKIFTSTAIAYHINVISDEYFFTQQTKRQDGSIKLGILVYLTLNMDEENILLEETDNLNNLEIASKLIEKYSIQKKYNLELTELINNKFIQNIDNKTYVNYYFAMYKKKFKDLSFKVLTKKFKKLI
jgi:hypothetical protein